MKKREKFALDDEKKKMEIIDRVWKIKRLKDKKCIKISSIYISKFVKFGREKNKLFLIEKCFVSLARILYVTVRIKLLFFIC